MAWRKLGRVFAGPSGRHPALLTHAALPTAFPLEGDLVRVFYSGRDQANRSSVGSVVLRLGEQPRVEEAPAEPVLVPGGVGGFDDAGVGVGSVIGCQGGDRLYYMGWNVGGSAPWRNAIGIAFGDARNARFERGYLGPIMDRSPIDPYSLSYPWVLRLAADDWRMWYGTHLQWGASQADMSHAIRSAISSDGLEWRRDAQPRVPPQGEEIATVRPSVLRKADGGFEMAFAARSLDGPYAIARAVSGDGERWGRLEPGIGPTDDWEGGALTYPCMFEQNRRRWLLFNGQGYGATGFGLAVWEDG
ncbi:MAG: hypothetical protein JO303_01970 [Caulobacteraceae bacterium]|nr:hypothetical protein [Caulobacteraceae bacterium]